MAYAPPDPPVVPYLTASPEHEALDWYVRAFGGRETVRYDMDDGRLGHAVIELGNGGMIYLAEGATVIRPTADEFYGRHGKLRDPYGHVWSLIGPKRED